jgi:hypothetical protein
LVIDIIDGHELFQNQFKKRRAFYNQKNYRIFRTSNKNYEDYVKYMRSINAKDNALLAIEDELFNVNSDTSSFIESKVKNLWNYLLVRKNKSKNKNSTISDANEASKNNNEYKCLIKL